MPLFLARHGQTDWNLEHRFQSRTDIPLNDTGRAQARRIRTRLLAAGVKLAEVRCSPLRRAVETAEIILADTGLTPEIDQGLLEIALGDFEGEREADLRDRMGEAFDHWRGLHFTKAAPNGESIFDAIKRLGATLASVGTRHSEENVLLVAHQGINMAIMSAISGRTDLEDLANFRQRNDQVEVWDLSKGVRLERFEV